MSSPQGTEYSAYLSQFWDEMPPEKGAQILYSLAIQQLLKHGQAFKKDAEYELFSPGELSQVMSAAVKLKEMDAGHGPAIDPYAIAALTPAEYVAQVMQGLRAWEYRYQQAFGRGIKAAFWMDVEAVLTGLFAQERLAEKYTIAAETPTAAETEQLRKDLRLPSHESPWAHPEGD